MDERGRNNNTRAKLTQTNEHCMIHPHARELSREDWAINANGTSGQYREEEANTQRHVVIVLWPGASRIHSIAFGIYTVSESYVSCIARARATVRYTYSTPAWK
jgi:hypothetical protein